MLWTGVISDGVSWYACCPEPPKVVSCAVNVKVINHVKYIEVVAPLIGVQ